MLIDLSSNQQLYPFDESKVRLEFEFMEQRQSFKKIKVKEKGGIFETEKFVDTDSEKAKDAKAVYANVRFRYHL